ncbi:solute carrier family 2 member 9, like 1 [Neolamprologus brichardi]|uniref:solute carrier family 2 member 9, like 1 n=1 Tax=Neolamprologus brichardi TaxID=32507 RepID=UPI001643875A|nr:solute carrier family 2 member 9, like 1 [Neolamprologus brichardi]
MTQTHGNALFLILVLGLGGSFQVGFHVTGLSSPSPYIQRFINSSWYDRYGEPPHPQTVTMIWSLIVSMFAVGGLLGAISVKFMSDLLGRKKAMICNSFIAVLAAGFMLASKNVNSFEMIIVARFLFGYSAGWKPEARKERPGNAGKADGRNTEATWKKTSRRTNKGQREAHTINTHKDSSYWVPYITVSLMVVFIMFFCGGPGGATPTLNSELFIQSNRMASLVLTGLLQWFMFAVMGLVFPFLIDALSSYLFLLFASACMLGSLYTFFLLPETKGKTLLEISAEFKAITVCGKSFAEETRTETRL